ncbi:MAG: glycosyltransferase [Nitrososphaerales archaeon]
MGKSICLATAELDGLTRNAGIGTYYHELAKLLKQNGWDVVILFHPYDGRDISKFCEAYHDTYGIPIYDANKLCEREYVSEILRDSNWYQARSHIVHEAIQVLFRKYGYKFDLIEFPEWGGMGFIPILMNKNFKSYSGSKIIVKLHSPEIWILEAHERPWLSFSNLKLDYMERYSFENADIQVSPTNYLLQFCFQHGWRIKADASICKYPIRLNNKYEPISDRNRCDEIIFFGRFEERKGIIKFIDALKYIKSISPTFSREYKITFIGKEGSVSKRYILENLTDFECKLFTFEREEAINYLSQNARIVVIPSITDNFPNTILECMHSWIPFVTSRSGGIPEMLGIGSELYNNISCMSDDPKNLGDLILKYLKYDEGTIQELLTSAHSRVMEITNSKEILHWYDEKAFKNKEHQYDERRNDELPWVTVVVPTRDITTSNYLETTIRSLFAQTYKNIQILISDSSTESIAAKTLENLKKKYPSLKVIRNHEEGVGNAMNLALSHVDTKYVLEVDADNIAKRDMVQIMVECMENRSDVAALSCYYAGFTDETEDKVLREIEGNYNYTPTYYYKPTGTVPIVLFFENTQGDANSIFLTDVVKMIGGWPTETNGVHDWSMWIKLLANGHNVDVIPKLLFYYRNRQESTYKTKKQFYIDESNIKYVRKLIENRAEYFSYSYESLHRLIRHPTDPQFGELYDLHVKLNQLRARYPLIGNQLVRIAAKVLMMADKMLRI